MAGRKRNGKVEQVFRLARERYAGCGVDVDQALKRLSEARISLHCWQGDDVGGFEGRGGELGGGLAVTGRYPGRARNAEELRADLEMALGQIPGRHRVNLHASYGEFGRSKVDRDEIEPRHFAGWIAWAKRHRLGLDFNPTFFAHPKAADGFTLAHQDKGIRRFWIEHGRRCREIGSAMGQALGGRCVTNIWIPDGFKDVPVDRSGPRERLEESLDAILGRALKFNLDSVEPKLFGIGSESYVVGSYDFYLGYAAARQKILCLDTGHFHPTESVADKISSVLRFVPEVLLHLSRGVRWDSDHVVAHSEELLWIAREVVRNPGRIRIGLDYFDASINRVAAWVIGARTVLRALLQALLEPMEELERAERGGDFTARLALQEEGRSLPWGAVWDWHCETQDVPVSREWLEHVRAYEKSVVGNRT